MKNICLFINVLSFSQDFIDKKKLTYLILSYFVSTSTLQANQAEFTYSQLFTSVTLPLVKVLVQFRLNFTETKHDLEYPKCLHDIKVLARIVKLFIVNCYYL